MNKISELHDPIVAEIHATRERLANEFHNDLGAYSKSAEAHCRAMGFKFEEERDFRKDVAAPVNVHT